MGVPGFFGWIIKTISELKKTGIIGENMFNIILDTIEDNVNKFYIDGNCLIHPICFYTLDKYYDDPRTVNVNFLHNKMYENVFKYIKYLITFVKPTQVFLAIDGVAPLAKISQQRNRRFMSVQDNKIINQIKYKYNKYKKEIWNNTCISPGTEFMEGLHKFLQIKLQELSHKKSLKITYSSYHVCSEGEHKILQDIKQEEINNDSCNIIYGLDADLIFLALASHKNKIFLLREESQLTTNSKQNDTMFENLNYISINNLKEAINYKIALDLSIKSNSLNINMNENNYNFIDDFIFICYLLGNDFIPHIPSIDIKIGGLEIILKCYVKIFIRFKKYLLNTQDNNIYVNNLFFHELIKFIAGYEEAHFTVFLPKYLEKLNNRKPKCTDQCDIEIWNFNNVVDRDENFPHVNDINTWKFNYYSRYFGIDGSQEEIINKACYKYIEGIIWTTKYYFDKCPSWDYQYNYNYCPFASDISNYLKKNNINLNHFKFHEQRQTPVTIFTQLITMMPPQRNMLLPLSYRKMITNESSIIDMYPTKITIDKVNKDTRFKCIPNLPTTDITRIINCTQNLILSEEEKKRNLFEENIIYGQ